MNVWKIHWWDADAGQQVRWRANQREARQRLVRARKEHREAHGSEPSDADITPVEIPMSKYGLVDWLNNNLTEDNG